MKTNNPVLEYCAAKSTGRKRAKWSFRFRTPDGDLLLQSAKTFNSKAEAEQGFISLIKSVASNQYNIEFLEDPKSRPHSPPAIHGRFAFKTQKAASRNRLLGYL